MPYNSAIPQATDQLSASQPQILANFQALGAIAGTSGVVASASLNTVPGSGFNFVYLSPQSITPPITFPAGNVALYSAKSGTTNRNELYVNTTTSAGLSQIPLTAGLVATPGWCTLNSGMYAFWGRQSNPGANLTVTLPAGTPTIIQFYTIQLTVQDSNATKLNSIVGVASTNAGAKTFTMYLNNSNVNTSVWWFAIGF